MDAGNTTVYEVDTDEYEQKGIDLFLPGNIKIGTTKTDVEKVLKNSVDFSKEENETSTSYILNKREELVHIWLSEEDVVCGITIIHRECLYK